MNEKNISSNKRQILAEFVTVFIFVFYIRFRPTKTKTKREVSFSLIENENEKVHFAHTKTKNGESDFCLTRTKTKGTYLKNSKPWLLPIGVLFQSGRFTLTSFRFISKLGLVYNSHELRSTGGDILMRHSACGHGLWAKLELLIYDARFKVHPVSNSFVSSVCYPSDFSKNLTASSKVFFLRVPGIVEFPAWGAHFSSMLTLKIAGFVAYL